MSAVETLAAYANIQNMGKKDRPYTEYMLINVSYLFVLKSTSKLEHHARINMSPVHRSTQIMNDPLALSDPKSGQIKRSPSFYYSSIKKISSGALISCVHPEN